MPPAKPNATPGRSPTSEALTSEAPTSEALRGARVLLIGPFAETTLGEARRLVADHGGVAVASLGEANTVVVGAAAGAGHLQTLKQQGGGIGVDFLTEPLFLQRLINADQGESLRGLHPLTAVAALVGAPPAAVRRWWRRGHLRPTRLLGRLPLFDWVEVQAAKRLAALLADGCTLPGIDAQVDELRAGLPGVDRPLLSPEVDAHGGRLLVRRGQGLTEPAGQGLLNFNEAGRATRPEPPAALALPRCEAPSSDGLRDEAWRLADRGDLAAAIEACRVLLLSGGGAADDHFLLANLLYERGDLGAARERYYAAIELDPEFVEPRVSLGCLLAEQHDDATAVALLRGAVGLEPDNAEAQRHLAATLDKAGDRRAAEPHWRRFLELCPTGAWADEARSRLAPAP